MPCWQLEVDPGGVVGVVRISRRHSSPGPGGRSRCRLGRRPRDLIHAPIVPGQHSLGERGRVTYGGRGQSGRGVGGVVQEVGAFGSGLRVADGPSRQVHDKGRKPASGQGEGEGREGCLPQDGGILWDDDRNVNFYLDAPPLPRTQRQHDPSLPPKLEVENVPSPSAAAPGSMAAKTNHTLAHRLVPRRLEHTS